MNRKRFLYYAGLLITTSIIFILIAIGISMRYYEREEMLISYWELHSVYFADEAVDLKNLKSSGLSFYKDNNMLLPKFKNYNGKAPITFSLWYYERIGFINGQVTIQDVNQNIFSGTYDIELFDFSTPQIVRLYSDSIEIYLQARERFSFNNTSIEAF